MHPPRVYLACPGGALGSDDTHQLVPGIDKRSGAFGLEPGDQAVDVDGGLGDVDNKSHGKNNATCKQLIYLFFVGMAVLNCRQMLKDRHNCGRRRSGGDLLAGFSHAVWLYFRFCLSSRHLEKLMPA